MTAERLMPRRQASRFASRAKLSGKEIVILMTRSPPVHDAPADCVSYRVHSTLAVPESFTAEETAALAPYFGNTDQPVFVLTNLPEAVKGALFARYSRSAKSIRRLFLDEFSDGIEAGADGAGTGAAPGRERAERLYRRVFDQYGDDSVAQLGSAHIACEGVSNILTKVLERGRLMSYLEQSTRYVPYTDRPGGRWKYVVPAELEDDADRSEFKEMLDRAFETYARWIQPLQEHFRARHPKAATDSDAVYRAVIRAKALDTLRGLLPAATRSNVGIFGSGQAYEMLLLRMRAHPLAETRQVADLMLRELRRVIPAFLQRVDRPDRGVRWSKYLETCERQARALANTITGALAPEPREEVTLADFDPEGEIKVVAAALYSVSELPLDRLLAIARRMTPEQRLRVLRTYTGDRENRRHRPGRAFEHATYTFDVVSDYGAFRDLQRHRMLTLEWQNLTTRHSYTPPADAIHQVGGLPDWQRVMDDSAALYDRLVRRSSPAVAQYAVPLAYRIRFYMRMNARQAIHVLELRTTPQGHPAYRRICRRMHRLIAERAGHTAIAQAMTFVNHSEVALERLASERAAHNKRARS